MDLQFSARSGWRRGHGVKRIAVNERGYRIGTSHPKCKLSDATIELILELRDAGLSYGAIAAKFDDPDEPSVSKSMVYQVCQGLKRSQVVARIKTVAEEIEVDISGWFEIGAGELRVARPA
jgi:hypothetical protein